MKVTHVIKDLEKSEWPVGMKAVQLSGKQFSSSSKSQTQNCHVPATPFLGTCLEVKAGTRQICVQLKVTATPFTSKRYGQTQGPNR